MPPPDTLTTVYATDETVAIRATGDFAVLCPEWQKLAYAKDGVFASGSPWVLTSAAVDFGAAGVAAGNVVLLKGGTPQTFKGSGELLAVDSVSGSNLTLRRIGMNAGVGSPPGPASGVTAVEFVVPTLFPQIESASFALNRQWNIDAGLPARTPADLYDLRDLREATVLTVLAERYEAENRSNTGDFKGKADLFRTLLVDVQSRLSIRWGTTGQDPPPSTVFSARLVR